MIAEQLSRRERQIMETLYALGEGGAREVAAAMREPEAYHIVRVTLTVLERKGHVRHRVEGRRNVYTPVQSAEKAQRSALTRITRTFFGGSSSRAVIALLDLSRDRLKESDLDELAAWVQAQSRSRKSK